VARLVVAVADDLRQATLIVSVVMEKLNELMELDKLPSIEQLAGSMPDLTGDLSTQEYIDRTRGRNEAAREDSNASVD